MSKISSTPAACVLSRSADHAIAERDRQRSGSSVGDCARSPAGSLVFRGAYRSELEGGGGVGQKTPRPRRRNAGGTLIGLSTRAKSIGLGSGRQLWSYRYIRSARRRAR